jgi:multiple sugar transport system permease protein
MRRHNTEFWAAIGFLAPNFLGFIVFTAGPVLFSLGAAFTSWNLDRSAPLRFIGLGNFVELMQDQYFWLYLLNTLYLMLGIPIAIAGSLILAMMLSQRLQGMVVYRTLFYLPTFTSGVALMILWKALYNPDFGPINYIISWLLDGLGINRLLALIGIGALEPPMWLLSIQNLLGLAVEEVKLTADRFGLGARDALIIMGIWTAIGGNNMLLYLAALTNVPQDLYEAAAIDGAGKWNTFWNVTWPQLMPTTFFICIMSFIGGLQGGFEQARVMTQGGPAGTTTTISYYIFIKGFQQFQMGYASAISWALFSMIFIFTLIGWRFGSRAMND